jgi:hypothetical protein
MIEETECSGDCISLYAQIGKTQLARAYYLGIGEEPDPKVLQELAAEDQQLLQKFDLTEGSNSIEIHGDETRNRNEVPTSSSSSSSKASKSAQPLAAGGARKTGGRAGKE